MNDDEEVLIDDTEWTELKKKLDAAPEVNT